MFYAFGFERYGIVVSDLYFVDPEPLAGQETPERGVRLELRVFDRGELQGNIYSARPVTVAEPVWRADLLESAEGPYGSFDRTHHHPQFSGWNPSHRVFDKELSADPVSWLSAKLSDLDAILDEAGAARHPADAADAAALRAAAPEIVDVVQRLLGRIYAGELATTPDEAADSVRASWL